MAQFDERALVLDVKEYRETSLLVRLFSETEGRLSLVARGARSSKDRSLAAALQPYAAIRARFSLKDAATMGNLLSAELEEAPFAAQESFAAYAAVTFWFEILRESSQERVSMGEIFPLSLAMLSQQKLDPGLTETYLTQLAMLCQNLGFALTWTACAVCALPRPRGSRPQYFSTSAGGLVCTPCATAGRANAVHLTPSTAALFTRVLAPDEAPAEAPPATVNDRLEVLGLLHRYLVHHIEHPLKTWQFFRDAIR